MDDLRLRIVSSSVLSSMRLNCVIPNTVLLEDCNDNAFLFGIKELIACLMP